METVVVTTRDRTREIVRGNLARIKLLSVAGPILCDERQTERVLRLLRNRRAWGIEPPLLMLAIHDDEEEAAAEQFRSGTAGDLARFMSVRQKGHNETVGHQMKISACRSAGGRIFFTCSFDPFAARASCASDCPLVGASVSTSC
ncbi:MAG: hypothetical protein HY000_23275 [Planctomycetes bacterium]|nr:hypothetical protein [Planctomycetota bacterium]